ncbi:MAG: FAD:protein FMN transferase [Hyphomicrobiaceae bacterium]|nr:FAD:protein FMN transferase [Hyphomicrobiaceae bacterium]
MHVLNRRRFLTIAAAAAAACPLGFPAHAATRKYWAGTALGARASIRLDHPDAEEIIKAVRSELERLEQIFSLYRANSELSRLNRDGELQLPSFEMVELLSLCDTIHKATSGHFDPTIQPVWAMYAEHHASGRTPSAAAIVRALQFVGWSGVFISPQRIRLGKNGMALTLNGIAQGFIADKVAALLRNRGLDNILIDTGEFYALGGRSHGGQWPVQIHSGQSPQDFRNVHLADNALSTSAPLGTVFDDAGRVGHILDSRSGLPAKTTLPLVSVRAPTAARADALSTAFCLMSADEIEKVVASNPDIKVFFSGANGICRSIATRNACTRPWSR